MGGQTISHGKHTNLYTKTIDHGGHLVIVISLQCTNIRFIALTGPTTFTSYCCKQSGKKQMIRRYNGDLTLISLLLYHSSEDIFFSLSNRKKKEIQWIHSLSCVFVAMPQQSSIHFIGVVSQTYHCTILLVDP